MTALRGFRGTTMTPPLLSIPRVVTLLASLLAALSSGTNYVYSAYSPQLGAKLGMTHTQLNVVALGGNLGVYISGPIWGKIVDKRGPRILLAGAFVFLLTGYIGIRHLYVSGLPEGATHISSFSFILLVFCSLFTGSGGNAGLTSSVNSTAKTFPDKARASTTGLVISGFGLSAFLFSTIAHVFFPGDTSSFLLLLALGTSIPMIIGFFFIRPIPLTHENLEGGEEGDDEEILTTLLPHHQSDHPAESHLLDHDVLGSTESLRSQEADPLTNLYGKNLFKSPDFWLLFSILSILCGIGLMYINNVGSMSQTLYAHDTREGEYDPSTAAGWQAAQVSTISVTSFLGRIFIGLISDYTKHTYRLPRSYCLTLVSIMFLLSQLVIVSVTSISTLWIASMLLGLAYGSLFSLLPTVCLEWFGMAHFSENWGYLCISPIFAANLFSLLFGNNLDRHSRPPSHSSPPLSRALSASLVGNPTLSYLVQYLSSSSPLSQIHRRDGPSSTTGESDRPLCLSGRECYISTIYLTTFATLLAILLSVYAGYRERFREINKPIAVRRRMARSPVTVPRKVSYLEDDERSSTLERQEARYD